MVTYFMQIKYVHDDEFEVKLHIINNAELLKTDFSK